MDACLKQRLFVDTTPSEPNAASEAIPAGFSNVPETLLAAGVLGQVEPMASQPDQALSMDGTKPIPHFSPLSESCCRKDVFVCAPPVF